METGRGRAAVLTSNLFPIKWHVLNNYFCSTFKGMRQSGFLTVDWIDDKIRIPHFGQLSIDAVLLCCAFCVV